MKQMNVLIVILTLALSSAAKSQQASGTDVGGGGGVHSSRMVEAIKEALVVIKYISPEKIQDIGSEPLEVQDLYRQNRNELVQVLSELSKDKSYRIIPVNNELYDKDFVPPKR